jgi:transcriptional regulator with XRE-family HTH domain
VLVYSRYHITSELEETELISQFNQFCPKFRIDSHFSDDLGAIQPAHSVQLELSGKHNNMKNWSPKNVFDPGVHLPSKFGDGLQRGTQLLNSLRSAVSGVYGRALQQEELAELIGKPKSTLNNWLNGDGQPSLKALLRMFETLPAPLRHQILDDPDICRCRPVFEHPRLSHDPVGVSCLKTIVSKQGRSRFGAGARVLSDLRADCARASSWNGCCTTPGITSGSRRRRASARIKSRFIRPMNSRGICFGHTASHSPWFVQLPKRSLTIATTMPSVRWSR